MAYPNRPTVRAKAKASENGGGKRKTWLSDGSVIKANVDVSPRLGFPWWKSPMMKEERLKKAASLRVNK